MRKAIGISGNETDCPEHLALCILSEPIPHHPCLPIVYQIPLLVLLGGVSGTWLPLTACAPAKVRFTLGELDVGGAVGGPRKLGCFIPWYWPGCVVARLNSGLADDRFAIEALPSRDGSGISAEDLIRFPGIGEEFMNEGDWIGVEDRERVEFPCG